ncbi:unnamed protein product [Rotaria socialis]|uniref:PAS domain-containing protein n=1 Tax=Rotaria socialis TaxID=392032 RepID=A0A820UHD7_9BILA|nr:unnamed protein product [Rotaria socialis]
MNTTNTKLKRTHSNEDSNNIRHQKEEILSIDKISLQDDQTTKTSPQTNKLDKASILRETACYFRKHHDELIIEINISSSRSRTTTDDIADMVKFSWKPPSNIVMSEEWIQTAIESMNCFLLVTKSDPDNAQTVYVSNHISSLLYYSQLIKKNKKMMKNISCHLLKSREFLGYNSYELIGHVHSDFVHPDDLPIIVRAQQIWKEVGNGKRDPYRFLTKGQQWVFLETHAQVQINSWTRKPEVQSSLKTSSTLRSSPQNQSSSSDTQITVSSIREKLSEYRIRKQAEIRVREEEIKVIENIIKFINEFELKRSKTLSSKPINSYTSNHLTGDTASSSPLNQRLKSYYPTTLIISSSLNEIIDDSSVRFSSIIFRHNSSADHPNVRSSNDETIFDQLTNSLFSPQQETFSLSSPLTSFATVSTFLLIPSIRLSLSPIRTITTTTTTTIESSQSSSSIEPITATTTITNADMISTEKSPRKSSFKHSLPPNSLVS